MIDQHTNFSSLKKFTRLFFVFFCAMIPSFIAMLIYSDLKWSLGRNLIESVIFSVLIIWVFSLLKNSRFKSIVVYVFFSFFTLCIYVEAVYFLIYQTYFSPSSIFVFLDSNPSEASEFLTFYFSRPLVILTLSTSVVFGLCLRQLFLMSKHFFTIEKSSVFYSFLLMGTLLSFLRFSKYIDYNFPYLFVRSFVLYQMESKELDVYKKNKNGNFKNLHKKSLGAKEISVLVLGESTTKSHLGIYGYQRPTTPLLSSQKNDLALFQDVISPNTYSVACVTKLLTLGNYETPKKTSQGSVIQLANAAQYETFWLSNQRPLGPYESLITKLSFSADHSKFITTAIAGHSKTLDEELLSDLDAVLNESESDKIFIFLHLIGTHHNYEDRYPPSFNIFKGTANSNFESASANEKINHYDNAVLYNDFILNAVIERVKLEDANSFVLYLSDHGEELYNDLNMAGHNEDTPTNSMYEIPFILWQSNKFKDRRNFNLDLNKRYMTDDLFHSLADLMAIDSEEVNYQRSIFNDNFKNRPRIILDSIDYDQSFKNKR